MAEFGGGGKMKYILGTVTVLAFYCLGLLIIALLAYNDMGKHCFTVMFFCGVFWRAFVGKYIFKDDEK